MKQVDPSPHSGESRIVPACSIAWDFVRSVHDHVSRSGSVVGRSPYEGVFQMQNFAEFFAELCASNAPIAPICLWIFRLCHVSRARHARWIDSQRGARQLLARTSGSELQHTAGDLTNGPAPALGCGVDSPGPSRRAPCLDSRPVVLVPARHARRGDVAPSRKPYLSRSGT